MRGTIGCADRNLQGTCLLGTAATLPSLPSSKTAKHDLPVSFSCPAPALGQSFQSSLLGTLFGSSSQSQISVVKEEITKTFDDPHSLSEKTASTSSSMLDIPSYLNLVSCRLRLDQVSLEYYR